MGVGVLAFALGEVPALFAILLSTYRASLPTCQEALSLIDLNGSYLGFSFFFFPPWFLFFPCKWIFLPLLQPKMDSNMLPIQGWP